ncbi:unnamed protein product [Peronospora belbahrii]|uniref:Uncharacterized protein n=1 Tax=Peronospora belbahrii TaxID=622444 RepID=A0ABN8CYI4_9STRA|nr:unnamed protein product [Peronospora belbahrii]
MSRTFPGIQWTSPSQQLDLTIDVPPHTADFLDLTINLEDNKIYTQTFQKALNLYLYPCPTSAHPPGVFTGLIHGLIRTYYIQNTKRIDFLSTLRLLYKRLRARGFSEYFLKRTFTLAYAKCRETNPKIQDNSQIIPYKITFDPNGPRQKTLNEMLNFRQLKFLLLRHRLGRLVEGH